MASESFEVEIAVKGRVGASARAAVAGFDVRVVPRHEVLVVPSGKVRDLLPVLEALGRVGVHVDRITHPRTHAPPG